MRSWCWPGSGQPSRTVPGLLIGELAFGVGTEQDSHVKIGVLAGSLLSALLATVVLRIRNRHYRRLCDEESRDRDADGVPDVYQQVDEQ